MSFQQVILNRNRWNRRIILNASGYNEDHRKVTQIDNGIKSNFS